MKMTMENTGTITPFVKGSSIDLNANNPIPSKQVKNTTAFDCWSSSATVNPLQSTNSRAMHQVTNSPNVYNIDALLTNSFGSKGAILANRVMMPAARIIWVSSRRRLNISWMGAQNSSSSRACRGNRIA